MLPACQPVCLLPSDHLKRVPVLLHCCSCTHLAHVRAWMLGAACRAREQLHGKRVAQKQRRLADMNQSISSKVRRLVTRGGDW